MKKIDIFQTYTLSYSADFNRHDAVMISVNELKGKLTCHR